MTRDRHPLARQTVTIRSGQFKGKKYKIEDWWQNVSGKSWMVCNDNPACLKYAIRGGINDQLPNDDEVVYGKIGMYGELIHSSELGEVV